MYETQLSHVKEVVEKLPLPAFVRDIEYEGDEDHLGDPCVRIRIIIADDAMPKFTRDRDALVREFKPYMEIQNKISDAIIKGNIGLWPYTSIATETDRATTANLA